MKPKGQGNPSLPEVRALSFVGSSLEDLREMPEDVRITMGAALFWAQTAGLGPDGGQHAGLHPSASKMKGALGNLLHAFQKKSKHGIATPKAALDLIRMRLQLARQREARAAKGKLP